MIVTTVKEALDNLPQGALTVERDMPWYVIVPQDDVQAAAEKVIANSDETDFASQAALVAHAREEYGIVVHDVILGTPVALGEHDTLTVRE